MSKKKKRKEICMWCGKGFVARDEMKKICPSCEELEKYRNEENKKKGYFG